MDILFRNNSDGLEHIRRRMIDELRRKGVTSGTVLDTMSRVPRHLFISEALRYNAYNDTSLPIGFGQTISTPYIIANMVQALGLTGDERVLEIGSGSGYQSAILAELADSLVALERIRELYVRARDVLFNLGYSNIKVLHADDFNLACGLFDAIIVSAGAKIVPSDLFSKLVNGGILVIPVGDSSGHRIKRFVKKSENAIVGEDIGEAVFVPLIMNKDTSGQLQIE